VPTIIQRLIESLCPHRFSWPHSGSHGQDYQVCLICGTAYEYDLVNMCRTGRVITPIEASAQELPRKQL
jgi:hypothetical protein